jgi:hypothetical protein
VTQMDSAERAAALRNKCFSLAKTCSIGFRSGEYFGTATLPSPPWNALSLGRHPVHRYCARWNYPTIYGTKR